MAVRLPSPLYGLESWPGFRKWEKVYKKDSQDTSGPHLYLLSVMNAFTRHTISLPAKWKLMYHVRWLSRVASVEMSLSALILLLIMTFSSNWVHVSTVVIYEPLLKYGLENINYTSEGFWDYCQIWTCYNESEKSRAFYIHEMSKICFLLSLGSSLLLTCWFHCVFVPVVKHLNVFDWSGGLASLFTACFIFFTIILFPIHLWIQELKTNKRTLLGWSYYIGWLVFLLYILCAILCFLNYKDSWRVCPQL